jgi:hypothetical protein
MMETDKGSGWMIALSVIVLIALPLAVKRWVENYHARRRK